MKSIKELLIKIKPLLTQKAIVLSVGALVVTGTAIGGSIIYMNKGEDANVTENGKEVSQSIDKNKTEDNKEDVENKANAKEDSIASKEEVVKEDTTKKEEVKEEVKEQASDSGTSNSGSGTSNQNTTPPPTPTPPPAPTPTPPPAPTPPPVPSIASGWKDDIANRIYADAGSPNRPNGSSNYSAAQFSLLDSLVKGWFNGSGESINAINDKMIKTFAEETDFPLRLVNLTTFSVKGLDYESILSECFSKRLGNMKGYLFVKVYYDATSNTSTIHLAGGNIGG